MKRHLLALTCLLLSAGASNGVFAQLDLETGWVRFRGPNGSGLSESSSAIPVSWKEGENILWKAELPGLGSSCPIILNGKIYLTSYTGFGIDPENPGKAADLKRHLLCLGAADGKEIWRATVDSTHAEDPYEGFIIEHGYASSTPATDGERIFVFFGKDGVVAFDLEGKQVWATNVGTKSDPAKWGGGASCVVVGGVVVVNAGIEGHAIVGLEATSGKELWRVENPKFTNSWSTPCIVEAGGRKEAVFNMPDLIVAIDPATGKQLWTVNSPITNTTCPSLAVAGDVVIATGGRGGQAIAVRCGGDGDVTESHVVWRAQLPAGIGTPIVVGNRMYWVGRGIAYCVNTENGEVVYKERLGGQEPSPDTAGGQRRGPAGDYASPIAVGNKIYYTMRNGLVHVIEGGDQLKVVATSSFDGDHGRFNATPAVSDGKLYVRGEKTLFCIGK